MQVRLKCCNIYAFVSFEYKLYKIFPIKNSPFFIKILFVFHLTEGADPGFENLFAKRLYDDLLSNYNRLIRPVNNSTDKLTVWLNLKLSQLIDVVG